MASHPSYARRASEFASATVTRQVCTIVRAEKAWQQAMRNKPRLQKFCLVLVPVAAVCASLVPFFMTGEMSLLGADEACRGRHITLQCTMFEMCDLESAQLYDASAHVRLYHSHAFNVVSGFFSTACFLLWVFFTPHHRPSASALDQKRASGAPTARIPCPPPQMHPYFTAPAPPPLPFFHKRLTCV
jgi:hypothetical protein